MMRRNLAVASILFGAWIRGMCADVCLALYCGTEGGYSDSCDGSGSGSFSESRIHQIG